MMMGVCRGQDAGSHMGIEKKQLIVLNRPQARLHESRHEMEAAEKLYAFNLGRLDAAGQPLGADAVESLLFLAARYKVLP